MQHLNDGVEKVVALFSNIAPSHYVWLSATAREELSGRQVNSEHVLDSVCTQDVPLQVCIFVLLSFII